MKMGNGRFKKAGLALASFGCLAAIAIVLLRADDGLNELRERGALEFVSDSTWTWHEFQFAEPCHALSPKLESWKARLEGSGRHFVMTDMEDRQTGPTVWARMPEFAMRPPLTLQAGRNCGFTVGLERTPPLLDRVIRSIRRLTDGR
jgi:hypothetical protein